MMSFGDEYEPEDMRGGKEVCPVTQQLKIHHGRGLFGLTPSWVVGTVNTAGWSPFFHLRERIEVQ